MPFSVPPDTQQGVVLPGNRFGYTGNVWIITFKSTNFAREITRVVVQPPKGINTTDGLALWTERELVSNAPSALSTGLSLVHPIPLPAGLGAYLVWGTGAGTLPTASLYTEGVFV